MQYSSPKSVAIMCGTFIVALVLLLTLSKAGECDKVEAFGMKIEVKCGNTQTSSLPPPLPHPAGPPVVFHAFPVSALLLGNWKWIGEASNYRIYGTDSFTSDGKYHRTIRSSVPGSEVSDSGTYTFRNNILTLYSGAYGTSTYAITNLNAQSFTSRQLGTNDFYYATRI